VKSGDLTAIAAALDAGADIEEQDKGATPLFLAIRSEHPEAAELLIKRGANVNKESAIGLPITGAVLNNSVVLMRVLLAHGADPNTAARGERMLHFAVANGCLDCVKVLVEAGADVNAIWVRGDPARLPAIITPYHLARRDNHPRSQPICWLMASSFKNPNRFPPSWQTVTRQRARRSLSPTAPRVMQQRRRADPQGGRICGRLSGATRHRPISTATPRPYWRGRGPGRTRTLTFFSPVLPSQPQA